MVSMSCQTVGFFLTCVICLAIANTKAQQEVINQDSLGLTIPNPLGSKPIFETNNQNGRYMSLNIPLIYEWTFHHHRGIDFKWEVSILSGSFRFLWDRVKLEDGQRHGPILISMFGFPLYENHEQPYA